MARQLTQQLQVGIKLMKKTIALTMTAVTCLGGFAMAQPPGGDEGLQRMMSLDKNDDGALSKDEVPERLLGLFSRADKDEDGQLTREEIIADRNSRERDGEGRGRDGEARGRDGEGRGMGDRGPGNRPEGMPPNPILMALDANRDGELSADEINNATAALKKLDRNGNGRIEITEMRPQRREGDTRAQGRPFGAGPGNMVKFMLERHDNDGDGKLSGDEIPERMRSNLAQIDANDDGSVDKTELEAMAKRFGSRGQGGRGSGDGGGNKPRNRPPVE